MRTTFLNCSKQDRKTFRERGRKHLEGRAEDFTFFMQWGSEKSEVEHGLNWDKCSPKKQAYIMQKFDETGSFYDYGLSVDYQEPDGRRRGYFRFQLSWGGPSDEIRFYFSGDGSRGMADKIEYVFLDWGTGVGFDVTGEDWAKWLWDWFQSCETVKYEYNRSKQYC